MPSSNVHRVDFCYVIIFSSTFVSYFIDIAFHPDIVFCPVPFYLFDILDGLYCLW